MATHTLEKMASGGMYDHVGGGFHRYATDPQWLVPHFEKMLYDNALLVTAYLEAYQATGVEGFKAVAQDILRYVERDMSSPDGGFYSATDADSLGPSGEREEGWFFRSVAHGPSCGCRAEKPVKHNLQGWGWWLVGGCATNSLFIQRPLFHARHSLSSILK